jgi:hypothetical protein
MKLSNGVNILHYSFFIEASAFRILCFPEEHPYQVLKESLYPYHP